ncbi:lasso peptide isopeptide bond-forming cyclase [Oscillatoriales cyanobacterium LEGE 11467]|uniref:asparagine synthase (glutamine-hydrolyzing) n=1 Tax=Zarconia navalis LEGE 11467 TaxID=1828826 RepID=A0A928VZV7_9CYAN|nr:lasso peptide isopeptide bond-forming cyclase [Zarconia navalis]MBE9041278.1 lasso peptide isopeptide bond-forming cyclase [Zarconia navalis LEGE 11467]
MSAITGLYYRDGRPVDRPKIDRTLEVLAHRGSDDLGVWYSDNVGLGHRMRWTTPESLYETLPQVDRTGNFAITADIRIDNRLQLLSALDFSTALADTITDSQILLAAYQKWGDRCPEYIFGDFAFAIWDAREQTLFCARDCFGVTPFYYYVSDRTFAFGSEIKALLSLEEVPREIDPERVGDYLISLWEDTSITFYRAIRRLPPAHWMKVSPDSVQMQPYWSLDPSRELHLGSEKEYAEGFREIFTEAVSCRLRSAYPVGSMLSGGLDSSSIACTAREILASSDGRPLPTFSAIFDDVPECDERPYINAVLEGGGMEPHYLGGDRISPLVESQRQLYHQDEPLFAFNLNLNWGLYGIAQQKGVRTILDGFDGDSTVSHGVGYLSELARDGRWLTLMREVRGYTQNFDRSFWEWMSPYLWNYAPPFKLGQRGWKSLQRRMGMQPKAAGSQPSWHSTVNENFLRQVDLGQRRKALGRALRKSRESQRAEHYYSLVRGVMPYTLEVMDKAAAAFGIDLRFPFWDRRLVEYCLSLPPEQKIHKGWTRMVMRRGMSGILPEAVQWRGGKSNLGPNFDRGFRKFEKDPIETLLFHHPGRIAPYTNIDALRQAYHHWIAGKDRGEDAMVLWRALNLDLWLQHRDRQSSPSQEMVSV